MGTGMVREIVIVEEADVAKVLVFARCGVRGLRFRVARNLLDGLLARAEAFARENGLKVSVVLASPVRDQTLLFGGGGVLIGAVAGAAFGGVQGAVVGGLAGGIAGVAAAHLRIRIHIEPSGDMLATLV